MMIKPKEYIESVEMTLTSSKSRHTHEEGQSERLTEMTEREESIKKCTNFFLNLIFLSNLDFFG